MQKKYPQIEDAYETLYKICKEALEKKYSGPLKEKALKNLEYELANIERQGTASMYLLFNDMLRGVEARPEEFCLRGMLSTTVISYILGFSSYEPLEIEPKVYSFFFFGQDGLNEPSFEISVTDDLYYRLVEYWKSYQGEIPYEKFVDLSDKLDKDGEKKWLGVLLGERSGQPDLDDRARIMFVTVNKDEIKKILNEDVWKACPHESLKDYVKCFGLSMNGIWSDSAENLYKEGIVPFDKLIANREDVYELLEAHDMTLQGIEITEEVRKGKIQKKGWSEEQLEELRAHNIPEWFINVCTKIPYLFPRAQAIEIYRFINS